MSPEQVTFLAITAAAVLLFVTEWLPVDVIGLLIVLSLAVTGLIDEQLAFSGFASQPALIVCAVFVLSAGLANAGVTDAIGLWVSRLSGGRETRAVLIVASAVAALSAFTHHLMITALMLPIVMRICRDRGLHPSRLLIPMATASSLGTTMTLIGAPAMLLANSVLVRHGEPSLGMFGVLAIGGPLTVMGVAAMLVLKAFLPRRSGREADDAAGGAREIWTEITVLEDSRWIGMHVEEFAAANAKRFEITSWIGRDGRAHRIDAAPGLRIAADDVFLVRIPADELASVDDGSGIALRPLEKFRERLPAAYAGRRNRGERLLEAVVAPRSTLAGRTLSEVHFLQRYGVVAVGIWRKTGWIHGKLAATRLREGDLIVLWGPPENLDGVTRDPSFLLFLPFRGRHKRREKRRLALGIMLASVAVAALGWQPPYVAFVAGALAMVLTGCLALRDAYGAIEVRIYVMIAGVIPLGLAMEATEVDLWFAGHVFAWIEGWPPFLMLMTFFWCAGLLTQVLSDAATTILLAPIAVAFADQAGISPTAAVVTTTIGAIASFLTPIGHHGNLLVLGPGGYRFADFLILGLPLTLLISIATCWLSLRVFV